MSGNPAVNVLDHGFVRLVSYMQPVPIEFSMYHPPIGWSGDLEIVRNARVSYDADWRTGGEESKDEKLIHYLAANNHTSPFESMIFTFEIKAPIFVVRQWHRHRTVRDIGGEAPRDADIFCEALQQHSQDGFRQYRVALESGIPRELARCFLGLNTYTRFFGTVDLHNLFHFIRLRMDAHAQWEIQQYGHALLDLIKPICPAAVRGFIDSLAT